jgi:hypothetical protein
MEIKEHDIVILDTNEFDSDGVPKESQGTIVHIYKNDNFVEVEFVMNGKTILLTLNKQSIKSCDHPYEHLNIRFGYQEVKCNRCGKELI